MGAILRVSNLPPETEEETLRKLLSDFAGVRSLRPVRSGLPRERLDDWVVEIRDRSVGERAMHALDGRYCRGRLLSVELEEIGPRAANGEEALRAVIRAVA